MRHRLPPLKKFAALFVLLAASGAAETVSQATDARVWLQVPAGDPPLREVRISRGSVSNAPWEKDPTVRVRHTDASFPIRWWSWSEATLRFTPDHDGRVILSLTGPWTADGHGGILRQEVLWDEIAAEGATVANGGFEIREGALPAGWQCPWAPYPGEGEWPLSLAKRAAGKYSAATWHNRPLQQVLQVRKGKPVTLRLQACAATPPGFVEPKALGDRTPAHRAAAMLARGVNFGNGWEADRSWGLSFTVDDVDCVAAEGFDHIRIPVAFHRYLRGGDKEMKLAPELLAELEPVLRRALEKKLVVLLDWHHFDEFTTDPQLHLGRFVAGWECIARHFREWPPSLFFELLNEPHGKLDTVALGSVYQRTLAAIRAIDSSRIIVASPGQWGAAGELDRLRLPDHDDRVIVTIHCYDPFHFTHQGAGWVGLRDLKGVVYPGPPPAPLVVADSLREKHGVGAFLDAYNTLPMAQNPSSSEPVKQMLELASQWSRRFGRPVHLGEFGAHNTGDDASRARYLRDVRTLAAARGIPWTVWEWKASFGYWDPKARAPRFRKALME